MEAEPPRPGRRRAPGTRERVQQVALRLFTEQGYEATSMRSIAGELGINKASLYHHFASKEAILQSLVDRRGDEVDALLEWLRAQPAGPGTVRAAVLRWVGSSTADKLRGIRFLAANPLLLDRSTSGPARVGTGLDELADALAAQVPHRSDESVVLLRMALLSVNAAVQAAARTTLDDAAVIGAATRSASSLVDLALQDHRPVRPGPDDDLEEAVPHP